MTRPDGAFDHTIWLLRRLVERSGAIKPGMDPMEIVDVVLAHVAESITMDPIPQGPEQIIAFIGSHFNRRYDAESLENVRFDLSVHDLQSAFSWWFDGAIAPPSATWQAGH